MPQVWALENFMEHYHWIDPEVPGPARGRRALQLVNNVVRDVPERDLPVEPYSSGRPIRDVLVVDPSLELQRTVRNVVGSAASVLGCSTFQDARSQLIYRPPDLLVTSVRLEAHNGLHLVYVASSNRRTRSIVHLTAADFDLARDVEAAGAFVVRSELWLEVAVWSLVFGHATVPCLGPESSV
jgi:hypothetical protein